ncbi:MAG: translation initiation factor IF-2 [Bacteroidetes bacterium]|jgi:translation initiation factor IF-2|nr:translation initiation factor IF-2 [Bacteroidota bacterium]
MATKEKFRKKRLFKVARDLNVSKDRLVQFLEEEGYGDALSGKGLNASITDEEAYLVLRKEYADDAEAAARVRELRATQSEGDGYSGDEVTKLEHEAEEAAEEAAAEEAAEASTDGAVEADEATAEPEAAEQAEAEAQPEPEAQADAEPEPEAEAAEPPAESKDGQEAPPPDAEEAPEAADEAQAPAEVDADAVAKEEAPPVDEPEPEAVEAPAEEEAEEEAPAASADGAVAAEEAETEEEAASEEGSEVEAQAETEPSAEADTTAEAEAEAGESADEPRAEEGEIEIEEVEGDIDIDLEDYDDAEDEEEIEETLKANRYKLSGTEVVGQVDLSQFNKPKRRRKRKRKEKSEDRDKSRSDRKQKKKKQKKKKRKKGRRREVTEEDVEQTIQETLQELEQGASRARRRRRRRRRERHARQREEERKREKAEEGVLRVTEFVSTGELANLMGESVSDVISTLFDAGMMVSINQRLDRDTIEFVAAEYDLDVEFIEEYSGGSIELEEDAPEDLEPRAPVVTVMGHVDHGKTSLLDYIRSANVVAGEAGGITQHIGAYHVELADKEGELTFLDTPGHEAFTAMRARGAKATDVVILVVAADDSVMPQTIEAINHAQAADVPIVVAINKIDKQEADPQKVMAELADHNVLVEQYGGKVQCAEVSAETGEGIPDLLEKLVLQAELLELQANPNRNADGIVIESRKEKGRGNVITVLVQNGTLEKGDPFVAGIHSGSVRAMFDERDNRVQDVGPSMAALVLGCDGQPEVGDQFVALDDEGVARDIANERQQIHREQELRRKSQVSLDQVSQRMATGEFQELNLIVKADVGGSVEALSDSLQKLKTNEVAVNIIHSGVGAITESDVMLARASDAVIIGFQVRPTPGARNTAEQEEVDIRTYSIIYDAIEDVRSALEGLLSPERNERTLGTAEVRETFKVPNVGMVAGSYVVDGEINRNSRIRVIRDGVVIYEGHLDSLKRFQDDVKEVQSGYECGISVKNFNDIKVGDQLESYEIVEKKRTLEV